LENTSVNLGIEQEIADCVIENIKIQDFRIRDYKLKLLDLMKETHKRLLSDIKDYL